MRLQARIWYKESKFEEAKCGALLAADVSEKAGSAQDAEECKAIIRDIEMKTKRPVTPPQPDSDRKPLRERRYFQCILTLHPQRVAPNANDCITPSHARTGPVFPRTSGLASG